MGILGIIKAVNTVSKVEEFVKKHEDEKKKVEALIDKVKGAIAYYQSHKDQIQSYIDNAEFVVSKLREITGK
jgi:hypothetical protein